VAWVGVIAIIGLVVCGLDALREWLRARRGDVPDDDRPWWRRRILLLESIATAVVLLVVAVLVIALGGSTSTPKIVAPPTTTTSTLPTTTTLPNSGRPPQLVHVEVINASAVPKAAALKAVALGALGYPVVGTANAAVRVGSVVECKAGFPSEAPALAAAVGPGTVVAPLSTPPPPGSTAADCVVILGK
jgi:hypothetical protein